MTDGVAREAGGRATDPDSAAPATPATPATPANPATPATPGTVEAEGDVGAPEEDGRRPTRSWRAVLFAPVGDGQRRRRGSDAFRVGIALVVGVLCWLATRVNPSSEKSLIGVVTPVPEGIKWLVTSLAWIGSLGLLVTVVVLALVSRRTAVIRDTVLAGAGAWLLCVGVEAVLGPDGGRPVAQAPHGFDLAFPVARVAAAVAVATAAMPYLSRWVQRIIIVTIAVLAVTTLVSGYGLPVAVLASLAVGIGTTGVVHLVFGSPLGLPSADEARLLLEDLGIAAVDVGPHQADLGVRAGSSAGSTATTSTSRSTDGTPPTPSSWPRRPGSSSTGTRVPPSPSPGASRSSTRPT